MRDELTRLIAQTNFANHSDVTVARKQLKHTASCGWFVINN
jgi:hypothetical protein